VLIGARRAAAATLNVSRSLYKPTEKVALQFLSLRLGHCATQRTNHLPQRVRSFTRATDHARRVANVAALDLRRLHQACHKLVAKCLQTSQHSSGGKILRVRHNLRRNFVLYMFGNVN